MEPDPPAAPPPISPPPPMPRPVVSLEYALNLGPKRPGILTAVGVLSITFGIIGIFYSGFETLSSAGMLFMSQMAPRINAAAAAANNNWGLTPSEEEMAEFVSGLEQIRPGQPLTERQRTTVEEFLRSHGQLILAEFARPVTAAAVAQSKSPSQPEGSARHRVYLFPGGALEVSDYHALWLPGNGAKGASLSPEQVEQVVRGVGRAANSPPAPEQYAALRGALSGTEQRLIALDGKGDPGQQIAGALVGSDVGDLTIYGQNGAILYILDAATLRSLEGGSPTTRAGAGSANRPMVVRSQTINVSTSGVTVTAGTPTTSPATNPTTNPAATAATFNFPTISVLWSFVAIVAALLSMGLAIFLLVIGIQVFRSNPRGRKRHLLYAWLKLLLVMAGAAAGMLMMRDLMNSMAPAGAAQRVSPVWALAMWSGGFALLRLGYPLALLIVMQTRRVREYYQALGEGQAR